MTGFDKGLTIAESWNANLRRELKEVLGITSNVQLRSYRMGKVPMKPWQAKAVEETFQKYGIMLPFDEIGES